MLDKLTKTFVAANALVWISLGPALLRPRSPRWKARHHAHEPDRDRRVMYGGVPLGILMAAMGLWRTERLLRDSFE